MDSRDESDAGRSSNRKILASRSGSGSECLLFPKHLFSAPAPMKSEIRWVLAGGIVLSVAFGVWKSRRFSSDGNAGSTLGADTVVPSEPSSGAGGGSGPQAASSPSAVDFAAAHLTPILFYGKVIDQNGNPVPAAEVEYSGNNIPWGGAARRQMKTDGKGEFKITTTGITLSVSVSKENYRSLLRRSDIDPAEAAGHPSSSDSFKYAKLFEPVVHRPDKARPVIFTLHQSGVLEPLIIDTGKDLIMAKDGSPLRVQLQPGNPKTVVELQCWTDDKARDAERHYDWRFKMTVSAGGLVERRGETAFTAPESGYDRQVFEYAMSKELVRNQWKDEMEKSFFVRFEDNTYAILDVHMISGGGHFAVVGFRLNPKPGSRNLETAPPKKPKFR